MSTIGHSTKGDKSPISGDINIDTKKTNRNFSVFYWISGFSFLISVFALCGAWIYKDVTVNNVAIILCFIGILATFIVVSNYAQVKEIENKFERLVSIQNDSFAIKINDLKNEMTLFESQKNETLSLMYLEIAKTYYNQPKENNYKSKLNYKENMLKAIACAEKTDNSSICETIDEFLSNVRVAFPKFHEKDRLRINKISQQIKFNRIKEGENFNHIEKFIFE